MIEAGFVKFKREYLHMPEIGKDPLRLLIFLWLLCSAYYQARRVNFQGRIYHVQTGEFVTSTRQLERELEGWGIKLQRIRTALRKFEKAGLIRITNDNSQVTRVALLNYEEEAMAYTTPQKGANTAGNTVPTQQKRKRNAQNKKVKECKISTPLTPHMKQAGGEEDTNPWLGVLKGDELRIYSSMG